MSHITTGDTPQNGRPYEKCLAMGPDNLSDAEPLTVIIRMGNRDSNSLILVEQILTLNYPKDGLTGSLHLPLQELMQVHGIDRVEAIQLLCIEELSRRIWKKEAARDVTVFDGPNAIVNYFMEDMRHMEQERPYVMFLNTKNVLIKGMLLAKGAVNATVASPREILIEALRYHTMNIILVHNHPSGDPIPSQDDFNLTGQTKEAGDLIGIRLMDHVVIGNNAYCSLREKGML